MQECKHLKVAYNWSDLFTPISVEEVTEITKGQKEVAITGLKALPTELLDTEHYYDCGGIYIVKDVTKLNTYFFLVQLPNGAVSKLRIISIVKEADVSNPYEVFVEELLKDSVKLGKIIVKEDINNEDNPSR